ncbi:hypothetical protein [Sphingomonas bacterium]|uniref:hypothetical protein n=1 Tax=Sphingomonas bacterium TaxID=1895847 RepID=UPI0015762D9A|nr:hypothetical protein [Sphingomonas bacterium]
MGPRRRLIEGLALLVAALPTAALAEDPARRACYADAKRLCPEAVHALSRKRAEVCLAAKIDQTSPGCHAMILKVRAQRAAALPGH